MTITQALAALCAAGRIRTPWVEGMAFGGSDGWIYVGRVISVEGERYPYEWEYNGYLRSRAEGHDWYELPPEPRCPPIVHADPATCGCLLALLREALQSPAVHTISFEWPAALWTTAGELHDRREWDGPTAASEGEAIAAALIALAGAP